MKKAAFILMTGLFLASCNTSAAPDSISSTDVEMEHDNKLKDIEETSGMILDWVDFVQTEKGHYKASYSAAIADPKHIGSKTAEVEFEVADVVSDINYKTKAGDAAFWEAGTEIFEVKGRPELAAVPDFNAINGYRIYYKDTGNEEFKEHFKDFDFSGVHTIEIYKGFNPPELVNTLTDKEQINDFFGMLEEPDADSTFAVNPNQPDPIYHQMVFYDKDQLARKFQLDFDNNQWVWYPWDREILPDAIGSYVES